MAEEQDQSQEQDEDMPTSVVRVWSDNQDTVGAVVLGIPGADFAGGFPAFTKAQPGTCRGAGLGVLMDHIFISHASEDDDFVTQLAGNLRESGFTTWVDHENLRPGKGWDTEVEQAIIDCELLMFIVTAAGLKSENCTDEWSHALSESKLVVPVMVEDGLANEDLPFRLKRRQWVDFRGHYESAFRELVNWLGLEGKTASLKPPLEMDREHDKSTAKLSA